MQNRDNTTAIKGYLVVLSKQGTGIINSISKMTESLKPAVEVEGGGYDASNINHDDGYNNSSSTQIIESLYNKVDSLTNTNLQLTLQSQNMLEKLDVAQKKEVKLVENISMYKHQKDNLDTMLRRKLRKINELEEELGSLRMTFGSVKTFNKELSDKLAELHQTEAANREKAGDLVRDYDLLLQSQDNYRTHFEKMANHLEDEMHATRNDYLNTLNQKVRSAGVFEVELNKYRKLIEQIEKKGALENVSKNITSEVFLTALKKLDLESWLILYKLSGNITHLYAEENNLDLKLLKNSDTILNDPELGTMKDELKNGTGECILIKKRSKPSRSISGQYSPMMYASTSSIGRVPRLPNAGNMSNNNTDIPLGRFTQRFNDTNGTGVNLGSKMNSPTLPGVGRLSSVQNGSQSGVTSTLRSPSFSENRRKRSSVIYN